jgi:hypothetical protein
MKNTPTKVPVLFLIPKHTRDYICISGTTNPITEYKLDGLAFALLYILVMGVSELTEPCRVTIDPNVLARRLNRKPRVIRQTLAALEKPGLIGVEGSGPLQVTLRCARIFDGENPN